MNWTTTEFERSSPKGDIRLTAGLRITPDGPTFGWAVITPLFELTGEAHALTMAFKHAEWAADLPWAHIGAWVGTTWEHHETLADGDVVIRRVRRVAGKYVGMVFVATTMGLLVRKIGPEFVTTRLDDAMSATLGAGEERAS